MFTVQVATAATRTLNQGMERWQIFRVYPGDHMFEAHAVVRVELEYAIKLVRPGEFIRRDAPAEAPGRTQALRFCQKHLAAPYVLVTARTLDCEARDVGQLLDKCGRKGCVAARFALIYGENAQRHAGQRENGPPPARLESVCPSEGPTIVFPKNVGHELRDDRLRLLVLRAVASSVITCDRQAFEETGVGGRQSGADGVSNLGTGAVE